MLWEKADAPTKDDASYFAVKTQRSPKRKWVDFQAEFNGIKRTSSLHRNIVPLLAAFYHGETPYLLFPWADGGSLESLWKDKVPSSGNPDSKATECYSLAWVLEQCSGLADGLSFIHGYQTDSLLQGQTPPTPQLHSDITPENILCFQTRVNQRTSYTLKIADFQFARQVNAQGETGSSETFRPQIYYAPEFDLSNTNTEALLTLKCDVWSLGCVFLEFVIWCVLGSYVDIENFRSAREKDFHDTGALEQLGMMTKETTPIFFRLKRNEQADVDAELRKSVIEVSY